ncbi:MAG: hypothetical protein NT023_07035 [Armatimonadetes bacterium]|nr:hypothetical protein [Armatimonadota bacterium]
MPIEPITVADRLVKAYKVADEAGLVARLKKKFSKTRIAITGASGIGKTVLFDHLVGKAPNLYYTPPLRSTSVEKANVPHKAMSLVTVPGDLLNPRSSALRDLFVGKDTVEGVIHVVCNGYIPLQYNDTTQSLSDQGVNTLQEYLEYRRRQEVEDFADVLGYIQRSVSAGQGKPKWLLIALAKCDLYANSEDARNHYIADTQSDFVKALNDFKAKVGAGFPISVQPVSTFLEDFQFGETIRPMLGERQRNKVLIEFLRVLEGYAK